MAKIVSVALSALMLLSTMSWSVDKHLCMGRVVDIAFFHQAETCGMEAGMASMGGAFEDNHCCDSESFAIEGQDDLSIAWDTLDMEMQHFLVAFTYSYLDILSVPLEKVVVRTPYPPPSLVYDLNLLHEVYLI